jgi:hypothetical protein
VNGDVIMRSYWSLRILLTEPGLLLNTGVKLSHVTLEEGLPTDVDVEWIW